MSDIFPYMRPIFWLALLGVCFGSFVLVHDLISIG